MAHLKITKEMKNANVGEISFSFVFMMKDSESNCF